MLEVGQTEKISIIVGETDTAKSLISKFGAKLPSDEYANVFATAKMIALMELASGRLLSKIQSPSQLSVGLEVNVKHLRATMTGQEVTIVSEYLGRKNLIYNFKVEAFDCTGKIGEGNHKRAIIERNRFMSYVSRRK